MIFNAAKNVEKKGREREIEKKKVKVKEGEKKLEREGAEKELRRGVLIIIEGKNKRNLQELQMERHALTCMDTH